MGQDTRVRNAFRAGDNRVLSALGRLVRGLIGTDWGHQLDDGAYAAGRY